MMPAFWQHSKENMSAASKRHDILGLAGWLALCFAGSAIGAAAAFEARTFYAELSKPLWAPPGWVFGPVWSILYTLMALAAWMVWRAGGFRARRIALGLFLTQLALNSLWSWLFFAWRRGSLAFAEVVLLWVLIAASVWTFWRVRQWAGLLLLPYLAWVGFAAALTFVLWQRNPQLLG